MFPPASLKAWRRHNKNVAGKRSRSQTIHKHALRVSPVRCQTPSTRRSSARSSYVLTERTASSQRDHVPSISRAAGSDAELQSMRAEAKRRLFDMKRRIVDRMLQKKAGETLNGVRQNTRLIYLGFKDADADGSGDVSFEEFKKYARDLNIGLNAKDIDLLCLALDRDGDGTITTKEFIDALCTADKAPEEDIVCRGRRLAKQNLEARLEAESNTQEAPRRKYSFPSQENTLRVGKKNRGSIWLHPLATGRQSSRPSTTSSLRMWPTEKTLEYHRHLRNRCSEDASDVLKKRGHGKSYASSPKFTENNLTWERVGLGRDGTSKMSPLYLSEDRRRFGLLESTFSDRHIGHKITKHSIPAWEKVHSFVPREVKRSRLAGTEGRILSAIQDRRELHSSQTRCRIAKKAMQQLHYLTANAEDQKVRERAIGIGVGKGLLRGERSLRHKMGQLGADGISLA